MAKRFHVTTFGCQMNVHDSERMRGMLASLGYEEAAEREAADVILFNTCSIRESADSRFIAHLGEAKRLKSEDPNRIVGVGGCWAQSVKDEVFQRFPFVDVAFGPGQIHKLAEFLNSDSLSAQGYFEFEDFSGHLPTRREREFQGWLQISQGCNCVCSYCIVPSTRGREVSRDPFELIAEAEALAADGVREVTLLGQNVNSYGRELPKDRRTSFAELLARVDAIEGIERIRYTSPHPKDMKEDVVRAHAELPALCEHIHLPLQSGSSAVLKRMRRTYDRRRYLDRVALIREHVPDCAITTDIIVGFPGETEADFEQTLEVVEEVGYDGAFTFVFSPRRETEAATMDGQLPHPVKVERMERLLEAVQRRANERSQRFVGRTLDVLVEGTSRTDPTKLRGRSRHNKAVNFDGAAEPGEFVGVEIETASSQTLRGVSAQPLSRLL
jgi:tRNA-2-methylthio-N6-dimethylallyladenosine synthase